MSKKSRRSWGTGSVSGPHANGSWDVRVSLRSDGSGKRRQIKHRVKAANKTAALRELERLRERYGLSGRDANRPLLSAYMQSWLRRKAERLSEKSIENYSGLCAAHIAPAIGHVRIDLIEHTHITLLLDRLRAKGCGPRTLQAAYDALRACLNHAVKVDRLLIVSPTVTVPRPSHYYEMSYYSAEEARRFLAAVGDDRFRALFHLVVAVGLRRGEVFGLKWGDIDLEGAVLSVRRALAESGKMKATKTKRSQRRVNLPRSIVEELRAHRDRMAVEKLAACELVFPSRCGMPMEPRSLYYQHFLPAMKRAGLRRIRFHDLRHTAATIRLAAGDNPKVVQEMLGHTKIETTLGVYGHVVPSMQEDSAALYDRLMSAET
jgi:integrase